MECDCPNIVCETVKAAEDGSGTILRFYECANKRTPARVTIGLPAKKVFLCDLMENVLEEIPVSNGLFRHTFANFEILTIRVEG